MDGLTFISNLIQAVVWPGVLLAFLLIFREEIKRLLKGLKRFEGPGGVKGEFSEGLEKAEKQADAAGLPIAPTTTTTTTTTTPSPHLTQSSDDDLMEFLIRAAPAAAVLRQWNEVERALTESFLPPGGRGREAEVIPMKLRLPESLQPVYEQLRSLRNQAAHQADRDMTPLQAEDYIRLAKRFLAEIVRQAPPVEVRDRG